MDFDEIKKLIRLVEKSRIDELEVEEGEKRIKISKGGVSEYKGRGQVAPPPVQVLETPPVAGQATPASAPKEDKKYHNIKSPMVGTFYRAPAEDSEPFVQEGDIIKKGQVLCIIEAMKLMNEIESDISGRIVQILPENGLPVEFGEVLFKIDPT